MAISIERHKLILDKLEEVSEKELKVLYRKCCIHISIKLNGKQKSGAHAEKNLGMRAADYYIGKAFENLYGGIWDWKFEKFTLLDQIIRMINSMISEEVRKYKQAQDSDYVTTYVDVEETFYDLSEDCTLEESIVKEEEYIEMLDCVKAAIDGDGELELYFLCVQEGMKSKEIALELDWPINKVYKITEKFLKIVKADSLITT